jgi:4'-phosphopantetheinyl transferase
MSSVPSSFLQAPFSLPIGAFAGVDRGLGRVSFAGFAVDASGCLIDSVSQWLSADEVAKAGRFLRNEDRERFVLGRAFIRGLAAECLRVEPSAVVLGESDKGKPCLPGSGLEFNVSHSGNAVLIAWSDGLPVGADVEAVGFKDAVTLADIGKVSFSAEERAVLSAAVERDKALVFHRIWVRKEAVIKAEGVGLGGPLQDFSVVRLEADAPIWAHEVTFPGTNCVWSLVDLEAPQGHCAALAVPHGATVAEGANVFLSGSHKIQ